MKSVILFCVYVSSTLALEGFGVTPQKWGYLTVRKGAYMFWWLHQTAANVANYTERPLVIWLQGGPGVSSSGFGNFEEIGPFDLNLKRRPHTWLRNFNVMFVDNPVGTGFSYVDELSALTTNNQQIAHDFLRFLQKFYKILPELTSTPLYIFAESYGGKMAAEIALAVDKAIKAGELNITLMGIGLGNSWISPIDSVLTWGPYLLAVGAVDQTGYERICKSAEDVRAAVDSFAWTNATELWRKTEGLCGLVTNNIDFYNILIKVHKSRPIRPRRLLTPDAIDDKVASIMTNYVSKALGVEVDFNAQGEDVFDKLVGDFMKPATNLVERLLNTTNIRVAVYSGQLDVIVNTLGTEHWVDRLRFKGADKWKTALRLSMIVDDVVEGYVKKAGNLAMYWVNRAGHEVPGDNPAAMDYILEDIQRDWRK